MNAGRERVGMFGRGIARERRVKGGIEEGLDEARVGGMEVVRLQLLLV